MHRHHFFALQASNRIFTRTYTSVRIFPADAFPRASCRRLRFPDDQQFVPYRLDALDIQGKLRGPVALGARARRAVERDDTIDRVDIKLELLQSRLGRDDGLHLGCELSVARSRGACGLLGCPVQRTRRAIAARGLVGSAVKALA